MERTKAGTEALLEQTGQRSLRAVTDFFTFVGGSVNLSYAIVRTVFRPPYYPGLFVEQCYHLGAKSLSLCAITGLSTGMVMSLQFGLGLERFGGKLYVPKIVGLSIMRELGPVLTCLMLAGRVGSGIAAEIGSMNVTQQIDAIRALGTDPMKRIVIPRVLAMLVMAPLLTIIADVVGILGGMFISYFELNIRPEYYFHESIVALKTTDFLAGMVKTFVFGFVISVSSCWYGLNTKGGTQGVGQATTRAVVASSILVTTSDFILTKIILLIERAIGVV